MLTTKEILKYSRQAMLPEIGFEGQQKLKAAKVAVIGAGGLGCPVLEYLAASGVGCLGIVDFDIIALHNLPRQILFAEKEVGAFKSVVAQEQLQRKNPTLVCEVMNEKLTTTNAALLLADYDVVVDASDNFATRYLVNDTCVALGKPLVYGSILKFQGQLSVFNLRGSKNLRDLFPTPPNPEDVPNCDQNGVLATLPGIIGTMMANETLKLLMDLPVLSNQLLLLDVLSWQIQRLNY